MLRSGRCPSYITEALLARTRREIHIASFCVRNAGERRVFSVAPFEKYNGPLHHHPDAFISLVGPRGGVNQGSATDKEAYSVRPCNQAAIRPIESAPPNCTSPRAPLLPCKALKAALSVDFWVQGAGTVESSARSSPVMAGFHHFCGTFLVISLPIRCSRREHPLKNILKGHSGLAYWSLVWGLSFAVKGNKRTLGRELRATWLS